MPHGTRGGHSVHWVETGMGPRSALLIHCTLAHAGAWKGLSAHLQDMASMTAFDLPSHGRSAPWTPGMDEPQLYCTRIAEAFCDGPTDLVGHSFGATVALRLAVERPDLVRSLVLIEPVFFAVARADAPEVQAGAERDMARFIAALEARDLKTAAEEFIGYWEGGRRWEQLPPEAQAVIIEQMAFVAEGEATLYEDHAGQLAPGVLDAVTQPVLLVEGGKSPPSIAAINGGLAARLPNASRVIVGGAGHMVPISHSAETASEIKHFWRAHPA